MGRGSGHPLIHGLLNIFSDRDATNAPRGVLFLQKKYVFVCAYRNDLNSTN